MPPSPANKTNEESAMRISAQGQAGKEYKSRLNKTRTWFLNQELYMMNAYILT